MGAEILNGGNVRLRRGSTERDSRVTAQPAEQANTVMLVHHRKKVAEKQTQKGIEQHSVCKTWGVAILLGADEGSGSPRV